VPGERPTSPVRTLRPGSVLVIVVAARTAKLSAVPRSIGTAAVRVEKASMKKEIAERSFIMIMLEGKEEKGLSENERK
jgi:hypothetical protein